MKLGKPSIKPLMKKLAEPQQRAGIVALAAFMMAIVACVLLAGALGAQEAAKNAH